MVFFGKRNFKHILFNNSSHESVGGQPTYSENVNIKNLVLSMGYKYYKKINKKNNINKELKNFLNLPGSSFSRSRNIHWVIKKFDKA